MPGRTNHTMSEVQRGGVRPMYQPTGWVYLRAGCTIRWQRGDREAYLLTGNTVGSWTMEGLLATIPVTRGGWTDLTELRSIRRAVDEEVAGPTVALESG